MKIQKSDDGLFDRIKHTSESVQDQIALLATVRTDGQDTWLDSARAEADAARARFKNSRKGVGVSFLHLGWFDCKRDTPEYGDLDALNKLYSAIKHAEGEPSKDRMYAAYQVGLQLAGLHARLYSPHVKRGRKTKQAAKDGHAKTHGTEAAKAARRAEYQKAYDATRTRTGKPKSWCFDVVAKRFGVSAKTIQRNVKS